VRTKQLPVPQSTTRMKTKKIIIEVFLALVVLTVPMFAFADTAPVFQVSGSNTSLVNASSVDVIWLNSVYDTTNSMSTSTGIFAPKISGYYYLHTKLRCQDLGTPSTMTNCRAQIYYNGVIVASNNPNVFVAGSQFNCDTEVSTIRYFNGTTDTAFFAAVSVGATNPSINNNTTVSYAEGFYLTPITPTLFGTGSSTLSTDNPNQNLFYGILLFLLVVGWIARYFSSQIHG